MATGGVGSCTAPFHWDSNDKKDPNVSTDTVWRFKEGNFDDGRGERSRKTGADNLPVRLMRGGVVLAELTTTVCLIFAETPLPTLPGYYSHKRMAASQAGAGTAGLSAAPRLHSTDIRL